jgi:hypothetical protein
MFTRTRHWILSWPTWTQFTHIIYSRSILILSSHPRPRLPSGLFPTIFPLDCCVHLFPCACYTFRPHHPLWFDHPNNIGEEYKLWSFSLRIFLHPPITSHLLTQIFFSALWYQTLSGWEAKFHIHTATITGKIRILYFKIQIIKHETRIWKRDTGLNEL